MKKTAQRQAALEVLKFVPDLVPAPRGSRALPGSLTPVQFLSAWFAQQQAKRQSPNWSKEARSVRY